MVDMILILSLTPNGLGIKELLLFWKCIKDKQKEYRVKFSLTINDLKNLLEDKEEKKMDIQSQLSHMDSQATIDVNDTQGLMRRIKLVMSEQLEITKSSQTNEVVNVKLHSDVQGVIQFILQRDMQLENKLSNLTR